MAKTIYYVFLVVGIFCIYITENTINVIHGTCLTLLGAISGLLFVILFYFFRHNSSYRKTIAKCDEARKLSDERKEKYKVFFVFSTIGGMYFISVINNLPSQPVELKAIYTVIKSDDFFRRNHSLKYIQMANGKKTLAYFPHKNQSFYVGEKVKVTEEKGLLGFAHVTNVTPYE